MQKDRINDKIKKNFFAAGKTNDKSRAKSNQTKDKKGNSVIFKNTESLFPGTD